MPTPVGRFAPSPTGPLHMGSMFVAVASYLDARARGGKWLLRIEDVDKARIVPGATEQIIYSLQQHGLQWNGDVLYQSGRDRQYTAAIKKLAEKQRIFYCNCSRVSLRQNPGPYPGHCRHNLRTNYIEAQGGAPASHAIRFRVDNHICQFNDLLRGPQAYAMKDLGDFVLRRRDSLFAYQLAVVIDDADQSVSHIVRGEDLLDSTPWQIELQHALGLPTPEYVHLPLIVQPGSGDKLSKQTAASPVDDNQPVTNLLKILRWLGQPQPSGDASSDCHTLLNWATENWCLRGISPASITYPEPG